MGEISVCNHTLVCKQHSMTIDINHFYSSVHPSGVYPWLQEISFRVNFNEIDYLIVINLRASFTEINKIIRVNEPVGNFYFVDYNESLVRFPYVLSITPENALAKLRTILTFL